MIQEVYKYKTILESLEDLINKSPYKKGYIIKEVGITAPTFYRKLKNLSFSVEEVIALLKVINPKEFYKQELLESLEASRKELEQGKTISSSEMRKLMREKIENHQ